MRVYLGTQPFGPEAPQDAGTMVKAMRVYLGAPTKQSVTGVNYPEGMPQSPLRRPLRVLFSYHYYQEEDIQRIVDETFAGVEVDLFADSGAFSAYTTGATISTEAYAAWLNRWGHLFAAAAGMDVIGDPAASRQRTEQLRGMVAHPKLPILPVFHVGEDWKHLTYWLDKVDYLAFGGMVPFSSQRALLRAWCAKAFKLVPPTTRVHGFGMTTWELMKAFPWYSVDSSSWTSGFRYAQLQFFDEHRGLFEKVHMRDVRAMLRHARLLQSYGLRPQHVRADAYDRDRLVAACVESWQRAEAWLERSRGGGFVPTSAPAHTCRESAPTTLKP